MTALFGNPAGLTSSKYLVEFRAGKMNLRGTTVNPDKRKGLVYIHQSDDSLMHFCWKDRTSGNVEDDLIIFPDDIEFKRIPKCTTGRVYILKFKSSSRKFFFWMQEPKTDKDEEFCKKVNETLNNPPAPGSSLGGGTGTSGTGPASLAGLQPALASLGDQLGDSNLQTLLNNMDQNQLMQLLGMTGLGGASGGSDSEAKSSTRSATRSSNETTTTVSNTPVTNSAALSSTATNAATTTSAAGSAVQLSDLQSILSQMQVPASTQENVDLAASFSADALFPLLCDKDVQERLKPFLPAVENLPSTDKEIRETIQSAQFKQALSVFSAALSSGQLGPLMQQFELNKSAVDAAAKGDIVAFVKALQESKVGKTEEEEDMALD